ncbi:MAG: methyltransferase domain-containing protein [bacterium]|nr:MAG: methyltransferase domain-containing protein [bacterium]
MKLFSKFNDFDLERSLKQVNYNEIASTYNERYEAGSFEGIASTLKSLIQNSSAKRILEVGCGTGHWLEKLQGVDRQVYGLDLSIGMLRQADQGLKSVYLICGQARYLPFFDACFDIIFCVNALHHFDQKQKFISQARQALRSGGILAIIGMDPHNGNNKWYIYHYFDGTYETDLARFPSAKTIKEWMTEAGFEQIKCNLTERIKKPLFGEEVLKTPYIQKHNSSQLILLSDEAYINGVNRIKADLRKAESLKKIIKFEVNISLWLITGIAP